MQGTKLIRILKSLSPSECTQLVLFAKSPLYNNGPRPHKVECLLENLIKHFQEHGNFSVSQKQLYIDVFGNEGYNKNKFGKLFSETVKVVRDFIVIHLSSQKLETQAGYWLSQSRHFRFHGLENDFLFAIKQFKKIQEKNQVREGDYYLENYLLQTESCKFLVNRNDKKGDVNLISTIDSLDLFYILSKLEYSSYLLVQNKNAKIQTENAFAMIKTVLTHAKNKFLSLPIVAAYYYSCLLLMEDDSTEDNYMYLKKTLKNNSESFDKNTLRAFHSLLRTHVAMRYNNGESEYLSELFALYVAHIKKGTVYQEEGCIPASIVQSAVTVALKIGEYKWAKKFLIEHKDRIAGADDAEAIYQFNIANCYFHEKKFEEAENILFQYQFREMFFKLAAKRMEIKILYETNSILLLSRLEAFKIFVHGLKKNVPNEMIQPNNYFADLMKQILAPKTLGNQVRIIKIIDRLKSQKGVAEREWLSEKLDKLLANFPRKALIKKS